MAELGALSLRIETTGGEQTLRTIRGVDDGAKKAAATEAALNKEIAAGTRLWALQAQTADVGNAKLVTSLRRAAKEQMALMGLVGATDAEMLRLGASVQSFQRRVEAAAAAQAKLGRAPQLGPALPGLTTASAASASAAMARQQSATAYAAEKVAITSGIAAIERRIQLLAKGAQLDATRAESVRRLIAVEGALENALRRSNLTTEQRITLNAALARSQAGIAGGTTQLAAALDRGAIASRRATTSQASQAAGLTVFGHAVTTTTGRLSGFSTKAIGGLNAAAFAMSSFTSGGTVNLRTLASAAAGFAAFFGPGGAIASIGITAGLAMTEFFTRTRREIEETRKKATEELGKLDAAVESARRSRDPASLQAKLADDTEEQAEKRIKLAAIEHRTAEARTDAEKALLPVLRDRLKVLDQEIDIGRRAIFSPREARGTGTLQTVTVETRDAAAAERERQERIGKTIDALSALQKLNKQTGQDLVQLARVYRELNAELLRGNVTLARRAEIEQQLAKVRDVSLQAPTLRAPLGGGAVGPVRQFDAEAIQRGIDQAPRAAIAARSTGLDEATATRLGSTFAGAFSGGFAEGLARGGVDDALRGFFSDVLGGVGSIFNDLLAQQITDGILSATASASIAGVAATTAATSASAATAAAAATAASASAAQATAAAATAAGAAGAAGAAAAGGAAAGGLAVAGGGLGALGGPWGILLGAVALPLLASLLSGGRRASAPSQQWRGAEVPLSVGRLIIDPNAGARSRVASSASRSVSAPSAPPGETIYVIGINTPKGQQLIGLANQQYTRRGG